MRNKVLIWWARLVFALMLACLCMLDSDDFVLFLGIAVMCLVYLVTYAYANKDYMGRIL